MTYPFPIAFFIWWRLVNSLGFRFSATAPPERTKTVYIQHGASTACFQVLHPICGHTKSRGHKCDVERRGQQGVGQGRPATLGRWEVRVWKMHKEVAKDCECSNEAIRD